ncbi:TPA: hypothetical protein ON538_003051 [Morganella morganii]|uniref:hypothetical protein n=1 Tax=Morganella morganii TaxID=582 RepID=UPI001BD93FA3|nr:hypothetical protein [Morganella morganii]MBT0318301.1 hypothetical protein [Morganella morganii subsp. morganii]HCR3336871.1 hypothetical protein [Morganella morganii]
MNDEKQREEYERVMGYIGKAAYYILMTGDLVLRDELINKLKLARDEASDVESVVLLDKAILAVSK